MAHSPEITRAARVLIRAFGELAPAGAIVTADPPWAAGPARGLVPRKRKLR